MPNKTSYPNYDQYMYLPNKQDTQKWLMTAKELFYQEKAGVNRPEAIKRLTKDWKATEVNDFQNWLKFYQEGAHMKYPKTAVAQMYYQNDSPGYFLHIKKDPETSSNSVSGHDFDAVRDGVSEELSPQEKKRIIEKQRNKIIGRLDSAEKMLRSPEGHVFAGKELESLLDIIFALKKKIQLVNKVSTSSKLYQDMIIKEANVLQRGGFSKASSWLHSFVQANNPPADNTGTDQPTDLTAPSAGDTGGNAGNPGYPGGLPSLAPGMPQQAPSSAVPNSAPNEMSPNDPKAAKQPLPTAAIGDATPLPQSVPAGIADFLKNMETANLSTSDVLEVQDDELVVEAQMAVPKLPEDVELTDTPAPVPLNPRSPTTAIPEADQTPDTIVPPSELRNLPQPAGNMQAQIDQTEEPIEVSEEDLPVDPQSSSMFDKKVDEVFSEITIADIVVKLEKLAKSFKERDLPRELAMIDMMLSSIGLISFFPSLSEAQNKALDSNNYISTRVDDILAKLRGAMPDRPSTPRSKESQNPEVANVKSNLQDVDEKEKRRKQMRKDQELADLEEPKKAVPQVEMAQDLAQPVATK